ncbi:hypothetical protein STCU_11836 [Strigomonas culicis]|uniref:Uncharacterized protein n=1 Tax=Strigomonas culicis TaxID=28005 RepID=S9TH77_9TRYP|nr:hypothetical protein STCU_11836 [Strigomonas culicis]|eukprot:EPY15683.1 hypothetical protein STCU_11836 [Strigomonas culicis]
MNFVMAHINAKALGTHLSSTSFPKYGVPFFNILTFMGNITIDGVRISEDLETYNAYNLNATALINEFGFAAANSSLATENYTIGAPTPAYCTFNCYSGVSTETLGPPGAQWTRRVHLQERVPQAVLHLPPGPPAVLRRLHRVQRKPLRHVPVDERRCVLRV